MGAQVEPLLGMSDAESDPRYIRVITVALGVFMTEGYEKATLELIAIQAGVSKNTIYQFFGCKSDLFKAAVRNIVHERFKDLAEPLDTEQDITITLTKFASKYMQVINCPVYGGCAFYEIPRLVVASAHREHDSRRFYIDEFYSFCWGTLKQYFERQMDCGRLPRVDIATCIELFFQLAHGPGFLIFDYDSPDIESIDRKMKNRVKIFLNACAILAESENSVPLPR